MRTCPESIYIDGIQLLASDWHWVDNELTLSFGMGPTERLTICDTAGNPTEYEINYNADNILCLQEITS